MTDSSSGSLVSDQIDARDRVVARLRSVRDAVADGVSGDGRAEWAGRLMDKGARRLRTAIGRQGGGLPESPGSAESGDEFEPPDDEAWTLALSFGTYVLADAIARRTSGERAEKMMRVVERIHAGLGSLLQDADMDGDIDVDDASISFLSLLATWPESDRVRLLIDLAFGDPFFPYSLKVHRQDFEHGLQHVADRVGLAPGIVAEIRDTRRSAVRAHHSMNLAAIGLFGAGGVLLIGTGAFALAPALGAYIGGLAGVYGAAGAAWGLAALGGGPIAAGGAGVAGGLWMVAGVGAAAGGAGGGGAALLYQLGSKQARVELTRLQVTFKMTVLRGQVDVLKAQQIMGSLHQQLDELRKTLVEECQLNDENSSRITSLKEKIEAVEESIAWMEHERSEAA